LKRESKKTSRKRQILTRLPKVKPPTGSLMDAPFLATPSILKKPQLKDIDKETTAHLQTMETEEDTHLHPLHLRDFHPLLNPLPLLNDVIITPLLMPSNLQSLNSSLATHLNSKNGSVNWIITSGYSRMTSMAMRKPKSSLPSHVAEMVFYTWRAMKNIMRKRFGNQY